MSETKLVKIYVKDWAILNDYLSIRQLQEGKRINFADLLGEVIRQNIKPIVDQVKDSLKR